MAEPDVLSPAPHPPPGAPGGNELSGLTGLDEALGGPERASERAAVYWVLIVILLGGSVLLRNSPWSSGEELHTLLETVATVLAFIVGGLSLVRFYSRKQATFLFIGTGFLGAALLDLNHTLLTIPLPGLDPTLPPELLGARPGTDPEDLFAWSWTAGRVFLSLFLFVSLLAWRQEVKEGKGEAVREGSVYATAVVLTVVNFFFFDLVPLTRAHFPGLPISRPAEFLPGLFFALAFFGFLAKGSWRRDSFEHWLLVSLLISMMSQVAFMSMSTRRFDAMFDAAHGLKIASYLAILTGLMISVYLTFRREGEVLGALRESNLALEREVAVRAQTEQAVKEGRQRLQDFLDNANDLIQSVAPDGKIQYVNSAWKRTLGYTDEQLEEANLFDIVHPQDRQRLKQEFDRLLRGERSRGIEIRFVTEDSRLVTLYGSATAQMVRGAPVGIQGIFRDVTEQRLAERQLAASEANLTALVENTGDTIWSVDREHRLITFNSAFALAMEARTGIEPSVGQVPVETFGAEEAPWYEEVYSRALRGERHSALREDVMGDRTTYLEFFANPIQGPDGISGVVVFGKDVTPRLRAEEALRIAKEEAEAANKAKSDFLANMSHELRTPLNSVIGFTNILLKNKKQHLDDKEVGFLQRVLSNGKHLLELINEVLDLAKVEAGRMELIIEEVDLAELIRETVGQLEGQAKVKEGGVALVADVPAQPAVVETDSAKLKQVIINLVGNALKFTHDGSVTVRLEMAQDGRTPTAIAVQDTGIGIPEDRLQAVFEAFQQAEAGTSRKYGGTGLGLAISRSICLLMGYDLIVESELGQGSTFSIVMGERAKRPVKEEEGEDEDDEDDVEPLTSPASVSAEARPPEVEPPAGAPASVGEAHSRLKDFRVLVIDDERDSRVLMRHYLEEFGCQVMTVRGGEEGLAAAREHKPDLITLDLMMPGMSGWEVLQHLKSDPEVRHIPVVVVSIVAGEGRGRLLGAVDLVTKPFEREDLLRVLWRNLVRKKGGRVLVVDDDEEARALVSGVLTEAGLEVLTAEDGEAALEAIRTEAPDAVLLDLMMPVMDGMSFLEHLRANPSHTGLPVIVLTAKELTEDERAELGDMASGVIAKEGDVGGNLRAMLGSLFRLEEHEAGDSS